MSLLQRLKRRRATLGIGLALLAVLPAVFHAPDLRIAETIRENAFDVADRFFPRRGNSLDVLVVDIDRASLAAYGRWPWRRATLVRLADAVVEAGPAVIAYDILLGLGVADEMEDAKRLAAAIARAPTVLGMVLDPISPQDSPEPALLLISGALAIGRIMQEDGVSAPPELLRRASAGLGVISLGHAESPVVRSVPLLAAGGNRIYAGLALEAVRVAQGASAYIVNGDPPEIRAGDIAAVIDDTASLRLRLTSEASRRLRTVSAKEVIEKRAGMPSFIGRIVVIGSSAPELGGLRSTPADPFISSAEIHANAIEQLLTKSLPRRPSSAMMLEIGASIGLGLIALAAALWLPPAIAGVIAVSASLLWIAGAAAVFAGNLLVDPITPALTGVLVFQGAALAAFTEQRRQRAEIEQRFSQHLPPEVVRRIAADPDIVRLEGEERIITALFTDIEGFTALGERADPRELVKLLDTYVERMCAVVVEHGGAVDKIVGDAVHAFFNAPIDLPEHPRKAVTCALAIITESEKLRGEPLAMKLKLGRTRVGIETGPAIVGDVGGGRRFDYTAHGPSVNTAAKLEAANKRFASSVAVGPTATAMVRGIPFRPLGIVQPAASSEPILASEPWPVATAEDLAQFREAYDAVGKEPARALRIFDALAQRYPTDAVIEQWRERLADEQPRSTAT